MKRILRRAHTPRPAVAVRSRGKGAALITALRQQIVTGALAPGQRIPSHGQLQTQFQTTKVTVQKALNQLAHDGFLRTERGRGTFVTDPPPHLAHYVLAFP